MNDLYALLEQIKPVSSGLQADLGEVMHARNYPPGASLGVPGDVPEYFFFIVRGIVETYVISGERRIITAFTGPNEVCFEPRCLLASVATGHGLIALADTEALCLSYASIRRLSMLYPEFGYHLQHFVGVREGYYERRIELLSEPTDVRLQRFMELYGHHFHAVTRALVSQYLSMSESHLYTLLQRQREEYHAKKKKKR